MEESRPLVSIIVRTKDRPKLLKRALQSIARQTHRPIEVVLVNDGGCDLDIDELRGIIGDVALNYVRLEKNTGRAHAGNVGIENAKGEYIGFLDDDDEFYPTHLETLTTFLTRHDYKIAYTDTEMVSQLDSSENKKMVDTVTAVFSTDFLYDELLINNYIPFNSLLCRAEVLERKGCLDESFNLYEDWDLLIRLAQDHKFFHIAKTTARYYQWNSQSQINQSDAEHMLASHLEVFSKHIHRFTPDIIYRLKQSRDALALQLDNLRTECSAHLEAGIKGKDQQLIAMEGLIRERDGIIAERENLIAVLETTVRERDGHISKLNNRILRSESELRNLISRKEEDIVGLLHDLETIRNTRGWRLLEKIRKAREMILHPVSGRGEAYRLASKSVQVIRCDGLATFIKKAKRKAIKSAVVSSPSTPVTSPAFTDEFCLEHFPTTRAFRVLFVKWEWAGITNHYRVDNMAEYLRIGHTDAEVIDLEALPQNIPHIYEFDLVIIHRIPMHPFLEEFIAACKRRRIIVIFDIDDYLFESSVIQDIEWVKHTKLAEREQLIEHMMQCRRTLDACDYFIAPTDFLAKKVEELGKKAYVVRNGFSRELYLQFSAKGEDAPADDSYVVRIGYFSGTNTHNKDFQSISPAILRILSEFDHASLYICGLLDVDDRFNPYSHKIERVPLVPLDGLAGAMEPCSINIAPLESGNIFCEAKSELKYMYAGILGIPTVASPNDAFRHAIVHGENGFLASTVDEWYECLKKLIRDPVLRSTMGRKARMHVVASYSPEALSVGVHKAYRDAILDARQQRNVPVQSISVGIVVADSFDNRENYPYVADVVKALTARGHHVSCYYYAGRSSNGDGVAAGVNDMDRIMSCDVLACTDPNNSSVSVYRHRDRAALLVYLSASLDKGIPYPWRISFDVIPYSPNAGKTAGLIESLVWEKTDRAKS